jgi:hypothetical protein
MTVGESSAARALRQTPPRVRVRPGTVPPGSAADLARAAAAITARPRSGTRRPPRSRERALDPRWLRAALAGLAALAVGESTPGPDYQRSVVSASRR